MEINKTIFSYDEMVKKFKEIIFPYILTPKEKKLSLPQLSKIS